jgi:hypothetical protein
MGFAVAAALSILHPPSSILHPRVFRAILHPRFACAYGFRGRRCPVQPPSRKRACKSPEPSQNEKEILKRSFKAVPGDRQG